MKQLRDPSKKDLLYHIADGCYCFVNDLIETSKVQTFVRSFSEFMRFTPLCILIYSTLSLCPGLFKGQSQDSDFFSVCGKEKIGSGLLLNDQSWLLESCKQDSQDDSNAFPYNTCKASPSLYSSYQFFYKNNRHLQKISLSLHQLYCSYLN